MEAPRGERAYGSLGPALRLLGLVLLFAAAQSARDLWRSLGGIARGGEAPPLPGPAELLCGLAALAVAAFFLRHADGNVQALAGGGQPLPPLTLRRLLQPRFEHPLRELWIRSHPGAPAVPMPASRNFGLFWAAGLAVAIPLWLLALVLPVSGRLPSGLDAVHHAAIAAACIAALHFASQLARRQDDGWQQAKPPIVPAPLRVVAARTQQLAAPPPPPAAKPAHPPAGRRTLPPPPPADAVREAPMQSSPPAPPKSAPPPVAAFALPASCPICSAKLTSRRCDACGAPALAATFRVLSSLGGAGARRTYLAEAPDRTRVVLKELSIATAPDAVALEAFAREAKMLRELRHPRLPVYVDAFQEEEGPRARLYLAYRYLDGVSLMQEMADRRYTEDEVLDLVEEVLEILRYLQTLQPPLIHRDLKPANLVRRRDGAIALIDFGVARSFDRTLNSGTMVGTVGYMPPEQLAGQADLTCDLYALGATALHMMTRTAPWEFMDGPELRLPRLESARLARKFLQRMVAPRRSQRFSSAREAAAALRQLRSGGRRLPRTALAAGAVAAATVALAALAVDRRATAPVAQAAAQMAKAVPVRTPVKTAPAASSALVRFRSGVLTSDEMKESLRRLPPWLKSDQPWWIHQHALSLVRLRLLAEEAQRRGFTAAGPDRERQLARAILNAEVDRDPDPVPGQAFRRAWTRLTSALFAAADVRVEDALLFQIEPGKLTGALPSATPSAETAARLEFMGRSGPCVVEVEPAQRRYGGRCEGIGSLAQALLDPDTLMLVDLSPLPRSFYARFTDDFVAARLLEGGEGLEKAAQAEQALASADLRVADVSGTISFAQVQSLLAAVQPALRRCLAAGLMDSHNRALRAHARIRIDLQESALRSARIETDPELAVSGCAQALARPELSGSGGFSIAADLSRVPSGP